MRERTRGWKSTFAFGLRAAPGAVGLAGSLGRTPEHVTGLAAEPDHAAHIKVISQPDAMRGDPWVTAQALAASC